jgi:hypothetical protein
VKVRQGAGIAVAAALALCAGMFIACGGGDESGPPQLANSPIPTAYIEPTATPVCDPESPLPLPENFPTAEILTPPDYRLKLVERTPFLRVSGVTEPPLDPNRRETPHGIVGQAMIVTLRERGWTLEAHTDREGFDIDFIAADGRRGHFVSLPVTGCPGYVSLTIEMPWITG